MIELTYADIQRVYRNEGNVPRLEEIPDDFYDQVSKILGKVDGEHRKNIIKFVSEIYKKRRNKIVLHALRLCDKNSVPLHATSVETKFYTDTVDLIENYTKTILMNNLESKSGDVESLVERKLKVRIIKPMPSIVGSDMQNYGPFRDGDVHDLPESNARMLIDREYAIEYVEQPQKAIEE